MSLFYKAQKAEKSGNTQEALEIYHGPSNTALLDRILDRLAVLRMTPTDCLVDMLTEALANTEPNADLILISPTPVDFSDMTRFGKLKNDPRLRTLMQRIRLVATSDEAFDKIFNVTMS